MPTEHPTIRCPKCERGAVDVAPDFDPLAPQNTLSGVERSAFSASCVNGHGWIESQDFNRRGTPVGTRERTLHA